MILLKRIKILVVLLAPLILIFICFNFLYFSTKFKTNDKVIKIGYQPYVVGHSNIILTLKKLKLLEKGDYKVIYIPFLSGPPLNEAIISGKIDIGFAGDLPTISLLASGAKVKILAVTNKSLRQAIIIDKEKLKEIKRLHDLKNKKIALVKGSSAHYFFFKTLKNHNINPQTVYLIHTDVTNQPFALITNQVDAVVSWEPWPTKIEKNGYGKIIIEGEYSGYIFAREDFIKKDLTITYDFIKSLQKALEFTQKNLYQTCIWVSQETHEDPKIICEAAKTDKIFQPGENIKPEENLIKKLKEGAEFLFSEGFINNLPNIDKQIDLSFIDNILSTQ